MSRLSVFSQDEKSILKALCRKLRGEGQEKITFSDFKFLKSYFDRATNEGKIGANSFGLNPILLDLKTALVVTEEIGHKREIIISILLNRCLKSGIISMQEIAERFGSNVNNILTSLVKINGLYAKSPTVESENFRNLLLSFANDMRIILIMIADRLVLMRHIADSDNEEARLQVSHEASKLYVPLAHKLGFYKMKSELEDLVIKYTEPEVYAELSRKLEETAASREDYMKNFIHPIEKALKSNPHIKYRIKGRTKSIHSIWQKMKRQKRPFEGIYDIFAIRIIIDSEPANEKSECWQVYSLVTDMYTPNPHRLRDWLSVPKTNGYESLHTTVMGPEGRWVEVQIRTERMDIIAEHGLAAHWRYKGVKSEKGLDSLLASIRDTLEHIAEEDVSDTKFKMELYKDDIFVFTPKGDLFHLPKGATILDFAFCIHTGVGSRCTGALVNGRNVPLKHVLNNGDQVEIVTSNSQTPKAAWLKIVQTSRARAKIRQALKDIGARQAALARETLERKFKNHKVEFDEREIDRLVRKMGFKRLTDFYQQVADGFIDVSDVLQRYKDMLAGDAAPTEAIHSAQDFTLNNEPERIGSGDILVIENNLKGVDYKFAKCCTPIFGDEIFGFVTISNGISIHRKDCSNARELRERYPWRVIEARWSDRDKNGNRLYAVNLRIVGHDDIGIVTNVTSVISQEKDVILRSINIDSHDSLFSGTLTLLIDEYSRLSKIVRKIEGIKGIKQVIRL